MNCDRHFKSGSRITLPVFLLAALLVAVATNSQAQLFKRDGGLFNRGPKAPKAQTADEIGVPTPVTGRVKAKKGFEVTFEIKAETKTPGAAVEFLIRTFPSAGKIVSMVSKPNERNKALVTYYADPNTSASADAFAFAVRYRGGRYSSAMRYDIDLEGGPAGDSGAKIQVPESVDFGNVAVGEEVVKEIAVSNIGESSYEQTLFLTPPWYLVEPTSGKLGIAGNSGGRIKVAFRPDLTGETSYFLSLSRSKAGTTKLFGSGTDPFRIGAEAVKLEIDPVTSERTGTITLENPGGKPIQVKTQVSPRLQASVLDRYLIAPGSPKEIEIALPPTDTAPFDGMVQFQMENGFSKYVKVIAPVVPGKLKVEIPESLSTEVINFGMVKAGESVEKRFNLQNIGGVAVPLEFHVPAPFQMLNDPGLQLGPRSEVSIALGLFPGAAQKGAVDVTMKVSGENQTLPIRLLGNVLPGPEGAATAKSANSMITAKPFRFGAPGARPVSPQKPITPEVVEIPLKSKSSGGGGIQASARKWKESLTPAEMASLKTPLGFVARPVVNWKVNPQLRRPEDLTLFERKATSLTIGWTAPKGTVPFEFVIEMRAVYQDPETGAVENVWVPYGNVEFERIDRLVKAKLNNLIPYSSYEIRVIMLGDRNDASAPSEIIVLETDAPMDWTYIYLVLGILFAIGLGFAIFKVVMDRRPEVYRSQYVDH